MFSGLCFKADARRHCDIVMTVLRDVQRIRLEAFAA
jgi:hypothetical protein